MADNISSDVFILSRSDLEARERRSYLRGVERGRLEARIAAGKEPVALNCANWKGGRCNTCGAQSQGMEVSAEFHCPNFSPRS